MYKLIPIETFGTAFFYQGLTFPLFRPLLQAIKPEGSIVAIAANSDSEQPIGLALAQILPDGKSAEVISIVVEPSYRSQGIGTALLTRLEEELTLRGCTSAKLDYTTGKPTTPAWERLLAKCNWTPAVLRYLVCKSDTQQILNAPFLHKEYRLPSSFTIFPWAEITPLERVALQQQQETQPWIEPFHIPFQHETPDLEPLNSLGLRYKGQVVGWVITHRIAADTIRYTSMFVKQDLQKMARGIALVIKAIQLQVEAVSSGANIPKAIWIVNHTNTGMVSFIKKHMEPYLTFLEENRASFKSLIDTKRV